MDSGANTVITHPDDPAVVRYLELTGSVPLKTSAGWVHARRALIDTPFGKRAGLVCSGAPRLLPAGEFEAFRSVRTVCKGGICYRVNWEDGVPVMGSTPMAAVSLHIATHLAKQRKRQKRKCKKRQARTRVNDAASESEDGAEPARVPDSPSSIASPVKSSLMPDDLTYDEVVRELDFTGLAGVRNLLLDFTGLAGVRDPHTHVRCGCEFCRMANLQNAPNLRGRGDDLTTLVPGQVIVADLCTDWSPSRDSDTVAFVAKDLSTGWLYVRALRGKVPEGVLAGLIEFQSMLAAAREATKRPLPGPWVLHTDKGGEFDNTTISGWLTTVNGTQRYAPKGRHIGAAEASVRAVVQGTRVSLFAAGLGPRFWPWAARAWVHNHNCNLPTYIEHRKLQGAPAESAVFGALVRFKPDIELKRERGNPVTYPAAYLGYPPDMRRGAEVAFMKSNGRIAITTVDVGKGGTGLIWSPPIEGRVAMAFKRITQDLVEITVPNYSDLKSGSPGLSSEEIADWIREHPPPVALRDRTSGCPACRGRNRAHTYDDSRGGAPCLLAGLSKEQIRFFRSWARGKSVEEQRKQLAMLRAGNTPGAKYPARSEADTARDSDSEADPKASASRDAKATRKGHAAQAGCTAEASASCDAEAGAQNMSKKPVRRIHKGAKAEALVVCEAHEDLMLCVGQHVRHGHVCEDCGQVYVHQHLIKEGGRHELRCVACTHVARAALEIEPEPEPFAAATLAFIALLSEPDPELPPEVQELGIAKLDDEHWMAQVTRKMSRTERSSPLGAEALRSEMFKICEKYRAVDVPISKQEARQMHPDATFSSLILLGFMKNVEKGPGKHKGRAVVLGDRVYRWDGSLVFDSSYDMHSELVALEEGRILDFFAARKGLSVESADVESAYLHEKWPEHLPKHYLIIPEELHQFLPERLCPHGIVQPVFCMRCCIYGHQISGHVFTGALRDLLLRHGYRAVGKQGSAAFLMKGSCLVGTYVDDVKAAGSPAELAELWRIIDKRYPGLKPGPCSEFLGIAQRITDKEIIYEMRDYCDAIVERYAPRAKARGCKNTRQEGSGTLGDDLVASENRSAGSQLQCIGPRIPGFVLDTRVSTGTSEDRRLYCENEESLPSGSIRWDRRMVFVQRC